MNGSVGGIDVDSMSSNSSRGSAYSTPRNGYGSTGSGHAPPRSSEGVHAPLRSAGSGPLRSARLASTGVTASTSGVTFRPPDSEALSLNLSGAAVAKKVGTIEGSIANVGFELEIKT